MPVIPSILGCEEVSRKFKDGSPPLTIHRAKLVNVVKGEPSPKAWRITNSVEIAFLKRGENVICQIKPGIEVLQLHIAGPRQHVGSRRVK
jgi:hypothetical protein